MTAQNDLDRQLNDFLRDGPDELPYPSFDAVRDRTERTAQRVVLGPWRLPEMNKILTIGLGTAAVVVALLVGAQLLGSPSGGTGSQITPSPEPTATPAPTTTSDASPSLAAAPPLTQSFTSTLHGLTVSYPEGWIAQAATESWTESTFPLDVTLPSIDVLHDPVRATRLFLTFASQPLGDATADAWVAEQMASGEGCGTTTEPITVDGAAGVIGAEGCDVAVVTAGGRGYWLQLYASDENPDAIAAYDRAWFEEVLATVRLHPEDAIDAAASAAP